MGYDVPAGRLTPETKVSAISWRGLRFTKSLGAIEADYHAWRQRKREIEDACLRRQSERLWAEAELFGGFA